MESKRKTAKKTAPTPIPEDVLAAAADVAANPRAEAADDLKQQLLDLEDQLDEKEQLVEALTERLEQAAEQLDRLHRKGADRGLHIGGLPPELVQEQKTLVGELQRAVEQWEDLQAGAALGRIEMQLSELRDLIASELPRLGTTASSSRLVAERELPPESTASTEKGLGKSPTAGWEKLKAGLLSAEPEPSHAPRLPAGELDLSEHEPPRSIDAAQASHEELESALHERDEYIAWLIRKLRAAAAWTPPSWESLEGLPQELGARVQTLEQALEEKLRLAEVELSVERARIGRDYNRLQQQQQQLEKQLKQLGSREQAETSPAEKTDRRWLKYLGVKSDQ